MTLLLVNAAAMEALPIFLDRLVSPTMAIILSVTAVLFFGERVLPCSLSRCRLLQFYLHSQPDLPSVAGHK